MLSSQQLSHWQYAPYHRAFKCSFLVNNIRFLKGFCWGGRPGMTLSGHPRTLSTSSFVRFIRSFGLDIWCAELQGQLHETLTLAYNGLGQVPVKAVKTAYQAAAQWA
jgi:hypothetical protein